MATYTDRLSAVSGRRATKYQNQIGVLHVRFARFAAAEKIFSEILGSTPDYTAAYVNLSNVYLLTGDLDRAVATLEDGVANTDGAPELSISLAQTFYNSGRRVEAAEIYHEVAELAPELAERYGHLGGGGSTARAGTGPDAPLLWNAGAE